MNSFLNRWLEYLAEQGHSIGTLERVESEARDCRRCGAGQSSLPRRA
jgi:hypothetical protein